MKSFSFQPSKWLSLLFCILFMGLSLDMQGQKISRDSGTQDNTVISPNDTLSTTATNYDPIDPNQGDQYCIEVDGASSTLPIPLYNSNNSHVYISDMTIDIPYVGYDIADGYIDAQSEGLFEANFYGTSLSSVLGSGYIELTISFTATYENGTSETISVVLAYCIQYFTGNRLAPTAPTTTTLSPNPAKDVVSIDFQIPEEGTALDIKIYNTLGQVVKSLEDSEDYAPGYHRGEYGIHDLEKGMYYVVIRIGDETQTLPLVKL